MIRQRFQTYGPKCAASPQIFAEVSAQIVSKAATYLTITSRQEVNINQRKLQERVEYLEERAMQDKKEYHLQKLALESTIAVMETERNEAFKKEKLSDERLRMGQEEHAKALAKLRSKYESRVAELEGQLLVLTTNLTENELKIRSREEDEFKKNTEFTKLNALIEQKLELTERELGEYKAKYNSKDADFKEVNRELNKTRKELQLLTNKAHLSESAHLEEVQQLKDEYEGKLKALREELEE